MELGYADGPDSNDDTADPICFRCGYDPNSTTTTEAKTADPSSTKRSLSRCSKCQVACYCSRECQIVHWKKGGEDGDVVSGGGGSGAHKFTCDGAYF